MNNTLNISRQDLQRLKSSFEKELRVLFITLDVYRVEVSRTRKYLKEKPTDKAERTLLNHFTAKVKNTRNKIERFSRIQKKIKKALT